MKYVFPHFPAQITTPYFRIGGVGLANCLFVYGKAIALAKSQNLTLIAPVWSNFSIGARLRRERDKRQYDNLFHHNNEISGFHRLLILLCCRRNVKYVNDIYDFFNPMLSQHEYVRDYIMCHIEQSALKLVHDFNFENSIAVHIRLGDFPDNRRTPIRWFVDKTNENSKGRRILIFSDGKDCELKEILSLPNVERVYFGNAIADMVAMSRCEYIIGSDSSFSAWAAFLGQVPCCFYRLQFGRILLDESKQTVENRI